MKQKQCSDRLQLAVGLFFLRIMIGVHFECILVPTRKRKEARSAFLLAFFTASLPILPARSKILLWRTDRL